MDTVADLFMSWEDIKNQFPNEWVLLGAPKWDGPRILSGVVLSHGSDKRIVCMDGPQHKEHFKTITVLYTGIFPVKSHSGLLRPIGKI